MLRRPFAGDGESGQIGHTGSWFGRLRTAASAGQRKSQIINRPCPACSGRDARDPATADATTDPLASPTRREQQILMLIARGATAGDIAAQLDISPLTARKHRENLMRKLDPHNTAEVVADAARQGIPLD
ncbi:response regulator transcription factor [Cupriavidus lacunae]|uniref:response regulator transcription factor n=1 Tax=Cupriavidus lacunae TaxID=2666307 RepID=UPI00244ADA8D|nr:LuxR C-terminal-related transcriptional regulator [Cupriavidus lacunae]